MSANAQHQQLQTEDEPDLISESRARILQSKDLIMQSDLAIQESNDILVMLSTALKDLGS